MSTQLTIITPTDLQSAGEVYKQNLSWLEKYKAKGQKLIASASSPKLTKDQDECISGISKGSIVQNARE